jgi:hypothetical protein
LDKRRGVKIQLARFSTRLEQLNDHLNQIDTSEEQLTTLQYARVQTEFRAVREFAENLSTTADEDAPFSEALEFGLKHGKALILRYVGELNEQLRDRKASVFSNDKQGLPSRYEKFRNKSLRVEKDFESLAARL